MLHKQGFCCRVEVFDCNGYSICSKIDRFLKRSSALQQKRDEGINLLLRLRHDIRSSTIMSGAASYNLLLDGKNVVDSGQGQLDY